MNNTVTAIESLHTNPVTPCTRAVRSQVPIGASRRLKAGFESADLLRHAVEEGQDDVA